MVYGVEIAVRGLDAADARPPPVASFDQTTGSASKSSPRPSTSHRNGSGGRGSGGSSSSSLAAMPAAVAAAAAAGPSSGREVLIKRSRPGQGRQERVDSGSAAKRSRGGEGIITAAAR